MIISRIYPIETGSCSSPITTSKRIFFNPGTKELYRHIIQRREGEIAPGDVIISRAHRGIQLSKQSSCQLNAGPIVVCTGAHTERCPHDKFIVDDATSDDIWWDNNKQCSEENFSSLYHKFLTYLRHKDLFVQDRLAGADERYAMPVRIITENAWHSLFVCNMLHRYKYKGYGRHLLPGFTVLHAPGFTSEPELDGTNSEACIILHLGKKMVLIAGTSYAGEIKKAIFTVMNYYLPQHGVLPMHCAVNYNPQSGDTALFFGLSGAGKTTLSTDNSRCLVGDEHSWTDHGVFNIERGGYARVIGLSREDEPEIFAATQKFGTILENVAYDSFFRSVDLNDDKITENTRASYATEAITNVDKVQGIASHPLHLIMLTADAFGVLPAIARLTREQAIYYFLSGYTSKISGIENGITQPEITFSSCFSAPFLPLHPCRYADLLAKKLAQHDLSCWLVNTGWTGCGSRIPIAYTRRLLESALSGELDDVMTAVDPIFQLEIPTYCPDVPQYLLNPIDRWKDKQAFAKQAETLVSHFQDNFRQFENLVDKAIQTAGPHSKALLAS